MSSEPLRMMCVTSSYPVHPRLKKITQCFSASTRGADPNIVCAAWDRSGDRKNEDINTYVSSEGYGSKLKKLAGMLSFAIFIRKRLLAVKPDIVVCRFFDMAFLGCLLARRSKVVYDVNDIPSDKSNFVTLIYKILEQFVLKKSDAVILSSRFFLTRYQKFSNKVVILENKPEREILKTGRFPFEKSRFTVSFIGVTRYYLVLENLILSVKDRDMDLLFFGYGPDDEKVRKLIEAHGIDNVYQFGRYSYKDIHKLYNISDLIWAAYPATTINTRSAISNKFFESILFYKPGVFNKNTSLGEYVETHGVGYTIDPESLGQVSELFDNVATDSFQYKKILEKMAIYAKENSSCWEENRYEKLFQLTNA